MDEARITGSLEQPGIVPVYSLGLGPDELPLMVMKRVSGTVWRELIYDPEHPGWKDIKGDRLVFHLEVLRRVCDAVHFAHSKGVVHRDLKTANVMIGAFGEVYVLDWGIACPVDTCDTAGRHIVGTPAFLAPEMLAIDDAPVTTRTDVYLLGGMLHEVLMGRPRHEGHELMKVLHEAWLSEPFDYPPEVPRELAELCNRAMRKHPAERVTDARAFADAIATYLEHRGSEHLVEAAMARVERQRALAPGADPTAARRLWAEASFGFRQAAEAWRGNPRVAEGTREGASLMVSHEIAARDLRAAAELLSTLDPAPAPLSEGLSSLRAALDAEAAELARLRSLARELDVKVSASERARLAAVAAIATAVLTPLALLTFARWGAAPTYGALALAPLALAALAGAATWRWHRVLLPNRASQGLVATPFVVLAGAALHLWIGARLGLSMGAAVAAAMLMGAAVFTIMGVVADRRLFVVAATALTATLVGAAYPTAALTVAAVTSLAAMTEVALIFRSFSRDHAEPGAGV